MPELHLGNQPAGQARRTPGTERGGVRNGVERADEQAAGVAAAAGLGSPAWVSSAGTSFNTDWDWTVDGNDQPGYMYLLRNDDGVFVTYLTRRRGTEAILPTPANPGIARCTDANRISKTVPTAGPAAHLRLTVHSRHRPGCSYCRKWARAQSRLLLDQRPPISTAADELPTREVSGSGERHVDRLGIAVAGDHIVARDRQCWSAAGAGDEGGHDVGGVAVEGSSSSVVAHCRSRIRVRRGFLDVSKRDSGVERCGDEAVPQRVWTDPFVDPRRLRQPSHDPSGGVPVEAAGAVVVQEDRPVLRVRRCRGRAPAPFSATAGWWRSCCLCDG